MCISMGIDPSVDTSRSLPQDVINSLAEEIVNESEDHDKDKENDSQLPGDAAQKGIHPSIVINFKF